ncbi:hypothetical protein [Calidifontibacter terrae]
MRVWFWVVLAVAVLALVAWYLSYTAARLDRLHGRVEGSVSALDAQLVRRAETVMELAHSGSLDPASSMLLAEAATRSLDASDAAEVHVEVREHGVDADRAQIESELTDTVRATLAGEAVRELQQIPGGEAAVRRVEQANRRVVLARAFHDDAVRAVRRVRTQPLVRVFRLAGRTSMPQVVDFDSELPELVEP